MVSADTIQGAIALLARSLVRSHQTRHLVGNYAHESLDASRLAYEVAGVISVLIEIIDQTKVFEAESIERPGETFFTLFMFLFRGETAGLDALAGSSSTVAARLVAVCTFIFDGFTLEFSSAIHGFQAECLSQ
jgi:hypothetical protein